MFIPHPDTIHQLSTLRHRALLTEAERQRALKPAGRDSATVAAPQASAPQPALPGHGVAGEASV